MSSEKETKEQEAKFFKMPKLTEATASVTSGNVV
jgi:hypothetical protein